MQRLQAGISSSHLTLRALFPWVSGFAGGSTAGRHLLAGQASCSHFLAPLSRHVSLLSKGRRYRSARSMLDVVVERKEPERIRSRKESAQGALGAAPKSHRPILPPWRSSTTALRTVDPGVEMAAWIGRGLRSPDHALLPSSTSQPYTGGRMGDASRFRRIGAVLSRVKQTAGLSAFDFLASVTVLGVARRSCRDNPCRPLALN